MISETSTAYGSRPLRHGKSRAFFRNHATRRLRKMDCPLNTRKDAKVLCGKLARCKASFKCASVQRFPLASFRVLSGRKTGGQNLLRVLRALRGKFPRC